MLCRAGRGLDSDLHKLRASFETPALPAPQDEEELFVALKMYLILRSAQRARLAVRDAALRRLLTVRGRAMSLR